VVVVIAELVGGALGAAIGYAARRYVEASRPAWLPAWLTPDAVEVVAPLVLGALLYAAGALARAEELRGLGGGVAAGGAAVGTRALLQTVVK